MLSTDPQVWIWRVTWMDGAVMRQGLQLSSRAVATLPYGSFLRVTRKTINSMGLSRLRIAAVQDATVEGWISEFLNPDSGMTGRIVEPVPFPGPTLYRVTLEDGAVIRSGIELYSPQIGHAPMGEILTIVDRAFSEYPEDQCIERLKLADNDGWVSLRINQLPPNNDLIFELV